jgi:RNA polymerase sigma-70 factor (ECF subfamily)
LLTRYRRPIILEFQSRRRCGYDEAEELAQDFICTLLRREFLDSVALERRSFRGFIKCCIERYLIDKSRRRPEPPMVPIGPADDPATPSVDPAAPEKPEDHASDREWFQTVLLDALLRLERECVERGHSALFESFRQRLTSDLDDLTYAKVAAQLGMQEGAVRVAHHRLRKSLLECLRAEVRDQCASEEDFHREWQALREYAGALGS